MENHDNTDLRAPGMQVQDNQQFILEAIYNRLQSENQQLFLSFQRETQINQQQLLALHSQVQQIMAILQRQALNPSLSIDQHERSNNARPELPSHEVKKTKKFFQ
jgi:hypothetical protein